METSNLICTANQINQITGVYMKWNTGLKCVDDLQTLKTMLRNPISTNIFRLFDRSRRTWKVLKREDVLRMGKHAQFSKHISDLIYVSVDSTVFKLTPFNLFQL